MLPGPDRIIACPHCGALARQHSLASGNTIGAILWSDGKQEAPMLPEFPAVTRCRGCGHFYWMEDAGVKGEIPFLAAESDKIPSAWATAPFADSLTRDEFIEAFDAGVAHSPEQERYLLVHYWWAVNDPIRQGKQREIGKRYRRTFENNMLKLCGTLSEKDPAERIIKAEISRELGYFDQTLRFLKNMPAEYRPMAEKLAELAEKKDCRVRKINVI